MSTGLSEDAGSAYNRLRHHARMLGTISRSFDELALSVAAAYFAALTKPAPESWATLVLRVALLAQRTHALDGIVVLGTQERQALEFFEAIVRENADLLVAPAVTAAGANVESLYAAV